MKTGLKHIVAAITTVSIGAWPLLAYFYGVEESNLVKERDRISAIVLKAISSPELRKNSATAKKAMQGALRTYLQQELRRAQQAGIHDTAAYLRIAKVFYLMENPSRSLEVLTLGVTENPAAVPLWMMIAALEVEAGRKREGLAVFKHAAHLDPANGRANNDAAHLCIQGSKKYRPDLQSALLYATKAVSLEPNNPYYLDTLAQVHFSLGKSAEAALLMDRARKLAPKEPYFNRHKQRASSPQKP